MHTAALTTGCPTGPYSAALPGWSVTFGAVVDAGHCVMAKQPAPAQLDRNGPGVMVLLKY